MLGMSGIDYMSLRVLGRARSVYMRVCSRFGQDESREIRRKAEEDENKARLKQMVM